MEQKNSSSSNRKEIIMLDLEHITMVRWEQKQADRLRLLRGKISRTTLQQKTEDLGFKVTQQYIQQLENPQNFQSRLKSGVLTVSIDVVQSLSKALNVDIGYFYNVSKTIVDT